MPNQPRPDDAPLNIRGPRQLWVDFAKACAALGVSRNKRLVDHAKADVEQWKANQQEDQ